MTIALKQPVLDLPSDDRIADVVSAFTGPDEVAWLDSAADSLDGQSRTGLLARRPIAVIEQFPQRPAEFRVGGRVLDRDDDGWRLWRRTHDRLRQGIEARPSDPAARVAGSYGPGWMGYIGYEMADQLERLPRREADDTGMPKLRVALFDRVIALDHHRGRAWAVIAPGLRVILGTAPAPDRDWRDDWSAATAAIRSLRKANASVTDESERPISAHASDSRAGVHDRACQEAGAVKRAAGSRAEFGIFRGPRSARSAPHFETARMEYESIVRRALDYISAGDIYQVNLAHRIRLDRVGDPFALHADVRRHNPAAYAALLRWHEPGGSHRAVVSASPELFLELRDGLVRTRPIKGTRPRIGDGVVDDVRRRELLDSGKDAAELAMIVDLHRNDLGRVCEIGSVQVPAPRRLEAHPTVFHTVADVIGRPRPGCTPFDVLESCFPAGSVTGAPKIRAMQIIHELETAPRVAYTGAVGWLGLNGDMTFNVAIRTLQQAGDAAWLHVGAGIVAESDPTSEYEETLAKARGVLEAVSGG